MTGKLTRLNIATKTRQDDLRKPCLSLIFHNCQTTIR